MKTILAPDPNPSKPQYVPPPGACDAHCHVFGPGAQFPYAPNRSYTPPDAPKEQLAALHKHLGFSRAVIVQASCHGTDNTAVIDALNWSRGAWRGVCMIDNTVTDDDLQTLHAAGVRGARFNFVAYLGGAPDLKVIEAIVARIKPMGLHLQVHLDAEDILIYRDFLLGLNIVFIVDHMGRVIAKNGLEQKPFNLLLDLQDGFKLAYVFISHDLAVVNYMADEIMVMSKGIVVEIADSDTIYRSPQNPYTRRLLASIPRGYEVAKPSLAA